MVFQIRDAAGKFSPILPKNKTNAEKRGYMKVSKRVCSVLMSVWLTQLPALAAGEAVATEAAAGNEMIATHSVVAEMTRAQAEQQVRDYLSREDVRQLMLRQGVSADEASARLASLSETELRQLSGQIEKARYGGDILVTVLIVVLIIFLIQRI